MGIKETSRQSGFLLFKEQLNEKFLDGFMDKFEADHIRLKWNHIVIWHAVFWLFSRNVPYLLNFSVPL